MMHNPPISRPWDGGGGGGAVLAFSSHGLSSPQSLKTNSALISERIRAKFERDTEPQKFNNLIHKETALREACYALGIHVNG